MFSIPFINSGSERTVLVKKNVIYSFVLRGVSILCSLMLVPLTLNYLSADQYGVWLTLNSIVTWFNVCEIGIGMGLKNKLGEALAVKDYELGKRYVSLTYVLLALIMLVFFSIFLVSAYLLNWNKILNIETLSNGQLIEFVIIVVFFFCLSFILKTMSIILEADQRVSYSSFMSVIGTIVILAVIWIMTKTMEPSLSRVAFVFCSVPVFITIIGSIYFFSGRYHMIKPSFKNLDFSYAKNLIGLSLNFFVLQVSSIVVFTTSNLIITQTIGPYDVTVYNICFKYFNIITLFFSLILSPMWPAYTNAFALGDIEWIKNGLKKFVMIWIGASMITFLLLVCSPIFYKLWVGDSVFIPFSLSVVMAIYIVISSWNNIFAQMLAGVGKIRLSIINSVLNAIIFVPICIYLIKTFGIIGAPLAMTVTILTSTFWQPVQCYKIVNRTAKGIWNK